MKAVFVSGYGRVIFVKGYAEILTSGSAHAKRRASLRAFLKTKNYLSLYRAQNIRCYRSADRR